jgi:hypothetical protein
MADRLRPRRVIKKRRDLIGDLAARSPAAGLTLPQAIHLFQPLFKCWTGRCQTCQQSVDLDRLPLRHHTQTE